MRGYIAGNVIGVNDGLSDGSGSVTGNGISVGLEKLTGAGDASYTATIVDNQVYDVDFGFGGITVTANGGGAVNPAVVEVHLDGNTVAEMGDGALRRLLRDRRRRRVQRRLRPARHRDGRQSVRRQWRRFRV